MRRRALLAAAIGIPAIVIAAVSAGSGQVVEVNNFNAVTGTSYINAAQCAGTDGLHLEWSTVLVSGAVFTSDGTYQIFASNTAPTDGFCPEANDTTKSPQVFAKQIDSAAAATIVQDKDDVPGSAAASAANFTCDSASEGKVLFVCSHWKDASGTAKGSASGKFIIQVAAPTKPTIVTPVGSGDGRLVVSWTAGEGGVEADHFIAEATPVGGGTTVTATTTSGGTTSVTIKGLTNNTEYSIVVRAVSVGGNESDPSDAALGTPMPSADFWDVYKQRGGVEEGGCTSGSAGTLALLGAASVLAVRRRKR